MAENFAARLLRWFDVHGRHDLPWQHPRTPYRVWLSEIMLQQTQVATVVPYFERFVARLPTLAALAAASEDEVFALWSGMGYYSRAKNLRRAAQLCVEGHGGELPCDFDALLALPGIGRSTAGAILAQAWNRRHAILDGNVKRVLTRFHGIAGWPGEKSIENQLWKLAHSHLPARRCADYTQAIMDLGAQVCTRRRARCGECPLRRECIAHRDGRVEALPARKPARARPVRRSCLVVLRDRAGRVLLEKRGPGAVWAGLWSLPEAADRKAARRLVACEHRPIARLRALAPITHDFTHYRLEAQPLLGDIECAGDTEDHAERRWLTPIQIASLGLPAPVRKLLAALPPRKSTEHCPTRTGRRVSGR